MGSEDTSSATPATSASLLLRVRNPDDRESWETFERIYGAIVRGYCRHWKLQDSDVVDVAQDVLTQVTVAIRSFEYDPAKGRFRGWLGTITANQIRKMLRSKASRREDLVGPESPDVTEMTDCSDPDSAWVELFSEGVLAEACRLVRAEFEEATWCCFEQTWFGNVPPRDVAANVGVSVRAV